ncbi:cell division protein FtsQ/DivIB [Sphingomonas flavalba]|uniref:cell division protein FtsQ/DivIB n=1 Tax=Sphingomonas flavalba TaxID=2559804 RepID=UPI0039E11C5F
MSGSATIRRGKRPRGSVQPKRRRQARKPSLLSRTAALVPVAPETVQRATTWVVVTAVTGVGIAIAFALGLPGMAGTALAEVTGKAGFEVDRVEVTGINRMDRLTVYAIALDQKSRAMPLVDLQRVRGELMQYGWIADARVSRRLPDTLVVDVVERSPAAVWQNQGRLALVDRGGVVLEDVSLSALPDLPLVIGPGANGQIASLESLLEAVPRIRPVLAGATWIGGRRWDLRFQSGETLALPEGDLAAKKALDRFATLDGSDRLLGRGFLRFDMRDPTRLVVRVDRNPKPIDAVQSDGAAAPVPAPTQAPREAPAPPDGGQLLRTSQTT